MGSRLMTSVVLLMTIDPHQPNCRWVLFAFFREPFFIRQLLDLAFVLCPPLWNPRYDTDPRLSAVSVRGNFNHTELRVIFSINANKIMRIVLHFTFYIWSAHLRCQCTTWGGAAGAGKVE
jgi:hypothetical protein